MTPLRAFTGSRRSRGAVVRVRPVGRVFKSICSERASERSATHSGIVGLRLGN